MNNKLTVSLDNDIIERAKLYAAKHHKSLSKLIENYFKILIEKSVKSKKIYSPLVNELLGSLKAKKKYNETKAITDYLSDKYL